MEAGWNRRKPPCGRGSAPNFAHVKSRRNCGPGSNVRYLTRRACGIGRGDIQMLKATKLTLAAALLAGSCGLAMAQAGGSGAGGGKSPPGTRGPPGAGRDPPRGPAEGPVKEKKNGA